jgi:methylenetetrahydrofolate reductase (NADPH)
VAVRVGGLLARGREVDADGRAALARLLAEPTFELLPLKNVRSRIEALPPGARVSVTASPGKGIEATLDLAAELQAAGFRAVPHLSARMVRDRAHLAAVLERAAAGGLTRAFVVGGDGADAGEFPDGLSLLRAIHEVGPVPAAIGVPCYPDGHAFIPDDALLSALRAKLRYASWMTTQLCFDPAKIAGWLAARRAEGIATPVVIGVPGVTEPHRLLSISARIGVRDTKRFVAKNLGFVTRLVRSGGFYRPDGLLAGLAATAADAGMGVDGVHLYTFNQVATTESWRQQYVASLMRRDGRGRRIA